MILFIFFKTFFFLLDALFLHLMLKILHFHGEPESRSPIKFWFEKKLSIKFWYDQFRNKKSKSKLLIVQEFSIDIVIKILTDFMILLKQIGDHIIFFIFNANTCIRDCKFYLLQIVIIFQVNCYKSLVSSFNWILN